MKKQQILIFYFCPKKEQKRVEKNQKNFFKKIQKRYWQKEIKMVQSKLPLLRQRKVHWKVNNKILWKKKPERYDSSRNKNFRKEKYWKDFKSFYKKRKKFKRAWQTLLKKDLYKVERRNIDTKTWEFDPGSG